MDLRHFSKIGILSCLVVGGAVLISNWKSFHPDLRSRHLATDSQSHVRINTDSVLATVDERFLSFAVDVSQVAGGNFWSGANTSRVQPFDFNRPKLKKLTSQLTPAFLRIGGTDADRLYYDLNGTSGGVPPKGYTLILTRPMFDSLNQFAQDLGLQIMFTLNAARGPRDGQRPWRRENAETLFKYVSQKKFPVSVWEFGNEVNGYLIAFKDFFVSAKRYTWDLGQVRKLIEQYTPDARLAGPASIFWPNLGEALRPAFPILPRVFKYGGGSLIDIVTWHYYPQQSPRCGFVQNLATPYRMLDPGQLHVFDKWSSDVEAVNQSDPSKTREVWLGETGDAQCGGAPGISDRVVAGLWWLDQLGRTARHGEKVAVRQTLAGAEYGLINNETLEPNPDYWNSVFWKKLMGQKVLDAQSDDTSLLSYAHCTPTNYTHYVSGSVTLLLINLKDQPVETSLGAPSSSSSALLYRFTSPDILGQKLLVNGTEMKADSTGDFLFPLPQAIPVNQNLKIEGRSYLFIVLPDANAKACN